MDLTVRLYSVLIFVPEAFLLWTVHLRVCTVVEEMAEMYSVKKIKYNCEMYGKKANNNKNSRYMVARTISVFYIKLKITVKV